MVEYLHKDGRQLPIEGSTVRYVPEDGSTPNVAIVKAVAQDDPWRVQLAIFWRDGQPEDAKPAGGWYRNDEKDHAPLTWHWPPRFQQVPDVFEELPDVSDDPQAQQRRIEELGG